MNNDRTETINMTVGGSREVNFEVTGGSGTSNYERLANKPSINDVELIGNKTSGDLGLQPAGEYLTEETDPIFNASPSANITSEDITNWNNKSDFSGDYDDLVNKPDLSGYITKDVNDLTYYTKTSDLSSVATSGSYNDLSNKPNIPTKTSDITNDSGFIDKSVDDLTNYTKTSGLSTVATSGSYNDLSNKPDLSGFITKSVNDLTYYYLKTETYSKTEVDSLIGAIQNISFEVVNTLPTTNIKTNVIYLVPKSTTATNNIKDEYINLDGTTAGWELIGDTEIDLSDYVTTTALNTALANYTTTADLTTLLTGYQAKIDSSHKISSDLVDDTSSTNKFVTASNKTAWNAKYDKPSGGIPDTDLSSAVQTSLGKADTALQSFTETDPVFSASASAGITSSDISNWNGKQDTLTAGDNITISNGTISATDTTYTAGTNITISDQNVISATGGGSGTEYGAGDNIYFSIPAEFKGDTEKLTLPVGYTQVDYIESTGTQYIDTGITPANGFGFEIDCMVLTQVSVSATSTKLLGSSKFNNGSWGGVFIGTYPTNAGGQLSWFNNSNLYDPGLTGYTRQTIKSRNNVYTKPNGATVNTPYSTDDYINGSLYLFTVHSDGTFGNAGARIYSCKLYNNDTLVRDFIPCYRNSDNEVGLYDLVGGTFYTNGGTGSLTYGREYHTVLTVSGNNKITLSDTGDTETENYSLNLGSIELCKIGTYQDKIYRQNGKWYKYNAIKKVTFKGTESWTSTYVDGSHTYCFWGKYETLNLPTGKFGTKYCDYFEYQEETWNNSTPNHLAENGSTSTSLSILFNVDSTIATTTQQWSTWLSNHNTTVYYVLETPTAEEITDTTLIGQLNDLVSGLSQDWVATITQVNDGLEMSIDYDNTTTYINASVPEISEKVFVLTDGSNFTSNTNKEILADWYKASTTDLGSGQYYPLYFQQYPIAISLSSSTYYLYYNQIYNIEGFNTNAKIRRYGYSLQFSNGQVSSLTSLGNYGIYNFMVVGYSNDSYAGYKQVLTTDNTTSYTPSSTYHPATKGYVDTAISGKYSKPSGGIPSADLDSSVQTSLSKADTALQSETYTGTITSVKMNGTTISSSGEADLGTVITSHQDISGKLDTSAVKTATDTTQGNVYDVTYINSTIGDIETLLSAI